MGDVSNPTPGSAYMTVWIRTASVYQNSNWWTNFVEKNRQAVLTINLNGTVAGINVSTTRTGNPINLVRNRSLVDMGYSGILVDFLPTTFSGMSVDLQINKTAKDGLQDLMSAVSQLSNAQPPVLPISQQALGIANLGKSIADFLFKSNLLVKFIDSQNPIPSTGVLAPGIYVSMAGDQQSDYAPLLDAGLKWNGNGLTHNNQPINKISYFVIEVAYKHRFFAAPLDSLSFGATRPWVSLYLLAQREIPTINNADEATKILNDVQSHLSDARALLDSDPDFIEAEKDEIASAVSDKLNDAYHARLAQIGVTPGNAPAQTGGNAELPAPGVAPGPRRNLMVFDSVITQRNGEMLKEIFKENANRSETARPH